MFEKKFQTRFGVSLLLLFLVGCTLIAQHQLDQRYGPAAVVERTAVQPAAAERGQFDTDIASPDFHIDIKPIIDKRCVVCHGCYDAPCQLKMTSFESIDRGASKAVVYDGARLLAGNLSRIEVDAGTTGQWRAEGFFPVLNERRQDPQANREAGLLYRMLALKDQHPLPNTAILPESFDFALNRDQSCSKIEDFEAFAQDKPLWGMPYGLPAISRAEKQQLQRWIESGAQARFPGVKPTINQLEVDQWEAFLNGSSLKQQLMSRYIYEHLFLANIYFSSNKGLLGEQREFFKLTRSKTPPGSAIDVIATRRPFDDPGGDVFYRLQRVKSTILAKQNMPYLFDRQRMQRWQQLFLDADYTVSSLPDYKPKNASNPFITFKQLPLASRYRFMLDEAQFTIMGFIKGPVCRGQVALNVINDHFWVVFSDPAMMEKYNVDDLLAEQQYHLSLPAEKQSNAFTPITGWLHYSRLESEYLKAKRKALAPILKGQDLLTLDALWDGDGHNPNAALTVFRHFDSSTVTKGLVGDVPKTAWVIGYPLLERIHYLLVAGFDVYGNVGHQLLTRLYMDFLRMEGENNFLTFLPRETAEQQLDFWYRGQESAVDSFLQELHGRVNETSGIEFKTTNPKREFFELLFSEWDKKVIRPDPINFLSPTETASGYISDLQRLSKVAGWPLQHLPEMSLLKLTTGEGEVKLISLVRNRAHSNVAHLFGEKERYIPEEQTLSVVEGVVGAYPNAFYAINEGQLPDFVAAVAGLDSEQAYYQLLSQYGVRRTDPGFWDYSDSIHEAYIKSEPIDAGFLDYNRLENR